MLIAKHIFPVLMIYFLQLLCVLSIFLFMTKCFVNVLYVLADDVVVNFVDIRLQLLLDPSSLAHYLVSRDDWRVCMAQLWFLL